MNCARSDRTARFCTPERKTRKIAVVFVFYSVPILTLRRAASSRIGAHCSSSKRLFHKKTRSILITSLLYNTPAEGSVPAAVPPCTPYNNVYVDVNIVCNVHATSTAHPFKRVWLLPHSMADFDVVAHTYYNDNTIA